MPCEFGKYGGRVVYLSLAGPICRIQAQDGKTYHFEMNGYFGPMAAKANGELRTRQYGARSPFWPAFELWQEQGERVTEDGVCIYDPAEGDRL